MIRRNVFHVSAAGYAGAQNLGARRANGPHIDGCRCLTCHIDAQVRERLEGRDDERETLQAHAADAPLRVNTGVLGLTGAGRASFARDDDEPMAPRGVLADPDPETLANQVHVFVADGRDSKGPYALVRGRGFRKVRPPARNAEAADAPLRPTTGVLA